MVIVSSGKRWDGQPCVFYMDGYLKSNFDDIIPRVKTKNWDYVCIVSGLPGVGKSNFAQNCAKYCSHWFDVTYIAFSAEQFIDMTNNCPEYSSVILDESFEDMNTGLGNSEAFRKIMNHLQIIRKRHLFIFLCIPDFFDLKKGVSIFRSYHLFLIYSDEEGERGFFCAFDRNTKRQLYIRGKKFLDYSVVEANFHGTFRRQKCIDEQVYEALNMKYCFERDKKKVKDKNFIRVLNFISFLSDQENWIQEKIALAGKMSQNTVSRLLNECKRFKD